MSEITINEVKAWDRAATAPETLTDDDIEVIAGNDAESRAAAFSLRAKALAHPSPARTGDTATKDDDFDEYIAQHAQLPVTLHLLNIWFEIFRREYVDLVWAQCKKLKTRVAELEAEKARATALEARLVALEERPLPLQYEGNHLPGKRYQTGAVVTRDGSMWVARIPTNETPGQGSDQWFLAVRRGKDGKDGRDAKDLR